MPPALPVLPQPRHPDACAWASGRPHGTSSTEAGRYRAFISRGGGLTVTGGEPLLQPAFVEDLFVGVKDALRAAHGPGHLRQRRAPGQRPAADQHRPGPAGHQGRQRRALRAGQRRRPAQRRPATFAARLVEHQVEGLDPVRARPGADRRPRRGRRGGRPVRRARRRSSTASRSCPTTGSAWTSTPPSGAPTRCWAPRRRRGSRSTRPWPSSESGACTPWPDQHCRARSVRLPCRSDRA